MEYKKIKNLVEIALGVVSDNEDDISDFGFKKDRVFYLKVKRDIEKGFIEYFNKLDKEENNEKLNEAF